MREVFLSGISAMKSSKLLLHEIEIGSHMSREINWAPSTINY